MANSPTDRLSLQLQGEPGAAIPDLHDAQRKAGVLVVDSGAYAAMSARALPRLGDASSFPVGGDAPIFDALMVELGLEGLGV